MRQGIHQFIAVGLLAHTCVEAAACYDVELGYKVAVARNAMASYPAKKMQAALQVSLPNDASAMVPTEEILASIAR